MIVDRSDDDEKRHLELVGRFGKHRIAKVVSKDDEIAFLAGEINSFLEGLRSRNRR